LSSRLRSRRSGAKPACAAACAGSSRRALRNAASAPAKFPERRRAAPSCTHTSGEFESISRAASKAFSAASPRPSAASALPSAQCAESSAASAPPSAAPRPAPARRGRVRAEKGRSATRPRPFPALRRRPAGAGPTPPRDARRLAALHPAPAASARGPARSPPHGRRTRSRPHDCARPRRRARPREAPPARPRCRASRFGPRDRVRSTSDPYPTLRLAGIEFIQRPTEAGPADGACGGLRGQHTQSLISPGFSYAFQLWLNQSAGLCIMSPQPHNLFDRDLIFDSDFRRRGRALVATKCALSRIPTSIERRINITNP